MTSNNGRKVASHPVASLAVLYRSFLEKRDVFCNVVTIRTSDTFEIWRCTMRNKTQFTLIFIFLFILITLSSSTSQSAADPDQPTVAKDSVQVTAFTFNNYRGNYDVWSWVPRMEFRVNGPIPSGAQLYAEFNIPGATPWVKFDCRTEETKAGYWWRTQCGGRDVPEEKGATSTGPVSFAIKIRNELSGTDATLFTGRAKVEKSLSNLGGPKAATKFVYYINHDWN